jgi:hypothetical protein
MLAGDTPGMRHTLHHAKREFKKGIALVFIVPMLVAIPVGLIYQLYLWVMSAL